MTGLEMLRLPEIPEGPAEAQLAAVKLYLYRLAEQLQYILSAERQERLREKRDFGTMETKMVDSPKLAQQVLALSDRHLRGQYVQYPDFERDRQRQEALIWENRNRLNTRFSDTPGEENPAFRWEGGPGWQTREGNRVRFSPLTVPEMPLKQVAQDRWQIT